jgi:hypothetical protein
LHVHQLSRQLQRLKGQHLERATLGG